MINTILKSLSATNFAPFANCIDFTTKIDDTKKEFIENTFTAGDDSFNKVSFIYGANGSGKTYFCKILREIQRLLKWSPLTAINNESILSLPQFKEIDSLIPKFTFDLAYQNKPTSFAIEIVIDKTTYHYKFSIQGKKVIYEMLSKKYRRKEILFERKSPSFEDIILRSELKTFESNKHVVKEEALCLPMAAFLNNPLASNLVEVICDIDVLNMTAPRILPSHSEESFSEARLEKYVKVLQKADPTLSKIKVSIKEQETARQTIDSDDFENKEMISTTTTIAVESEHAVKSEYEVDNNNIEGKRNSFDFFRDESLGTVKLFTVLPHLFDVLEYGGVLILDEIENGLHLSLVKDIIRLFTNTESNPANAQLICTSHQPLLVNKNTRRDQVWIICKDQYGKSKMSRLSKMSTSRAKVNLTNRLIEGALGCNPESFF